MMFASYPPTTFESTVSIVLEHLPLSLAAEENRALLLACARALPPIPRGLVEFRLDESPQVDLHQFFEGDEITRAEAFLADQTDHPAWQKTRQFLRLWRSTLRSKVNTLFLELDAVSLDHVFPSLFIHFYDMPPHEIHETAAHVLSVLNPVRKADNRILQQCFVTPSGAQVAHIGIMLARPTSAVRINVQGLMWDSVIPYLTSVEWGGRFDRLAPLIDWLSLTFARFTLCIDVGTEALPHVAFEVYFTSQTSDAAHWGDFLETLVERRLCIPAKRSAMLASRKIITPLNTQTAWMDDLIIESLLGDPQRFTTIALSLHHVKIMLSPDGALSAKGYLIFDHRWLENANAKI